MKRALILSLLLLGLLGVRAQDIHFSQMDADPMLLNPAYAGFFNGQGRFGIIYRNQWANISAPFQTYALTGEVALIRPPSHKQGLSAGVSLFNDHAGTLSYGSTSGHLSLAYYFSIDSRSTHFLSIGIEGGFAQSGFDPSKAVMDEPSESFVTQQANYPLIALGIAWNYQPHIDLCTKVGFSVRNANRPNISYLGNTDSYLERRYSLFLRAEWRKWESVSLLPTIVFQRQGQYQELLLGTDVVWYIQENGDHDLSLRTGLTLRQADALIANFIIHYDALLFNFCYDANISDLIAASGSVGALEVGMVYSIAPKKTKMRAYKCPEY